MSFEYHDYASRHRLSSSLTFVFKYGLITLVVVPMLFISVHAIFNIGEELGILIFCLSFAFVFYWLFGGIKSVEVDNRFIYISNFMKTIKLPLTAIEEIHEDRFINIRPITIKFFNMTEFGDQIVFIPYWSFSQFFPGESHPVITELSKLTRGRLK